jgi:hypothetical protein
MPVNETVDFRERLAAEMEMSIDAVVVNGLFPERFSGEDAERIEAVNGEHGHEAVAAALRAALWEEHRARDQRSQLRRLKRELGSPAGNGKAASVVTLPYLFEPELGLDAFERLSLELERKL